MSYRAGTIGLGALGIPDDDPRVVCNWCGLIWRVLPDRLPPAWLLDGESPPGWKKYGESARDRRDACRNCLREMKGN